MTFVPITCHREPRSGRGDPGLDLDCFVAAKLLPRNDGVMLVGLAIENSNTDAWQKEIPEN